MLKVVPESFRVGRQHRFVTVYCLLCLLILEAP